MTYAEVEFLLAEASLKGWNTGSKSIDELYRTGVRAAIDFLTESYGCDQVSDETFEDI